MVMLMQAFVCTREPIKQQSLIPEVHADILTEEHLPEKPSERARIETAGGSVSLTGMPVSKSVSQLLLYLRACMEPLPTTFCADPFKFWNLQTQCNLQTAIAYRGQMETSRGASTISFNWRSWVQAAWAHCSAVCLHEQADHRSG